MAPEMTAIVLVGGLGTRLRPVTYDVPKPLILMGDRPVLYHTLDGLPEEVTEIRVAAGYRVEDMERYFREHPYRVPIRVVKETEPLGTGGAMLNASKDASDTVIVLNGDTVSGFDLNKMLENHRKRNAFGSMALLEVENTKPYGVAALGEDGRILEFVEKPEPKDAPSNWINAGVSFWNREVFDYIPKGRQVSFEREVMQELLDRGVYGFKFTDWWEDAGTPASFLHAQRLIFDKRAKKRVFQGKGCKTEGAKIGDYVTLGENVTLGKGCIVEDSVILDGAKIGDNALVVRSIVGPNTIVDAGASIDGKCISAEGEKKTQT